ncbi:hypothetical protein AKJ53_00740 [candidate division MSBL1 archaeon SCGC-AAA382F02]|uniref:Transcription regulator AsnC/Lrp ligand binding domain-containing protein n=1 Tax=candidate division MSBL1 archaeon SCGC-AAA382F02 TaxID=1698282 RepID=A0A133VIM5_9EURY|nr:hypothetical protein AKJ53_00740 [candidate division MSBL1 archaeon SCGC-AAA382F02]
MGITEEAYVLVTASVGRVKEALEEIKNLEEVKEAQVVTGIYDVVALLEAADETSLEEVVEEKIQGIDGVRETTTAIIIK